jgi:hypothetical protein
MIRWLRVVLPSASFLPVLVAAVTGALTVAVLYLEARLGIRLDDLRRANLGILVGAAALYGAWRALGFHPLYVPGYRAWLAATPWTSRGPLPMGPIHLILQDVLLVGLNVLLALRAGGGPVEWVPEAFLGVYLVFVGASLFRTGCWPWGYGVFFVLGLAAYRWRAGDGLLAEVLAYAVAYVGLRRSLARFPWEKELARFGGAAPGVTAADRAVGQQIGWPFGRLAPKIATQTTSVPLHHALLASLLVGWWAFAAFSLMPDSQDRRHLLTLIVYGVVFVAPLIRLAVYCEGYAPPISLLGRLATGCWIMPGYDQVFVAPLLAVVVGSTLAGGSSLLGVDPAPAFPVVIAVVLLICLGMGPSLLAWRLTGEHRIVEGGQKAGAVKVG